MLEQGVYQPVLRRTRARRLPWTPDEDAALRRHYPDYGVIRRKLPHRSEGAISKRAGALRIRKKNHSWTCVELGRLKKLYESGRSRKELLAAFPDASWRQLEGEIRYHRFLRRSYGPKPSGFAIIDVIRLRARKMNVSMVELDAMARSKKYFQKAAWLTGNGLSGRYIYRAAKALGGHLSVDWDPLTEE